MKFLVLTILPLLVSAAATPYARAPVHRTRIRHPAHTTVVTATTTHVSTIDAPEGRTVAAHQTTTTSRDGARPTTTHWGHVTHPAPRFLPCGCSEVRVLHRACEAAVDTFRALVDRQVHQVVSGRGPEPWDTVAHDLAEALKRDGPSLHEFFDGAGKTAQRRMGGKTGWSFRTCAQSKLEQLSRSLGPEFLAEAIFHIALHREHDAGWTRRHDTIVCTEFLRSASPNHRGKTVITAAVEECHITDRALRRHRRAENAHARHLLL
jgi:hypothetical protein|eukprot:TRINITY_DN3958_c0_g1_i1.p2 TRINITY_DN3958_c0_g1~~TRINITY_DN3958_c0_g1_i1.p2  ORF type:complete len:264 (-),score=85.28 TRINITY_DN3958_c0_g1_i1:65-856(-)